LSETQFRINAAGLRGPELRDDDSIRILTIGDSCTWGWQVADDESYPARLQQLLDYRWGQGRYQVLNAGVPGTTSYQGLQYLRTRGLQLHPALVLAAYGFNDANTGGDVETQIAREAKALTFLRLDDWLLDNSRAYKATRWRVWKRAQRPADNRVPPDKYAENLRQIVMLAREHEAMVGFIGFEAGFKHDTARVNVARALDVLFVRYHGPKVDLVHPTADGYRDLANEIVDRLTFKGVLERLQGAH
jgi:lysophospholipase L1-like esterase